MSTKLFVAAIVVISLVLGAGILMTLNKSDNNSTVVGDPTTDATYTAADVKKHNSESDCWTIISGQVYDITSYLPRHPGGDEILRACGIDATTLFTTRTTTDGKPVGSGSPHSGNAEDQLSRLKIGMLSSN